jgi:GH25 family lysozyme M1 (1,4-beta-N-acetylmuramidase)
MEREKITVRAHGIDISHHQGEFNLAKTWGQIDFAIAKVGEGYNTPYSSTKIADPAEFEILWTGVSEVPIRGLYFYQRSGGYSWQMQAKITAQYIARLQVQPHMLWCDLEKINNRIDKTMLADTLRIMDYWRTALPGITIGLYTNKNVIQNYIIPVGGKYMGDEWVEQVRKYPLWYAQYYTARRSPDKQPSTVAGWSNWDIWQYTDKGDSYEVRDGVRMRHYGSPDLNVYNGTVEEMRAWLKLDGEAHQPPPTSSPTADRRVILDEAIAAIERIK